MQAPLPQGSDPLHAGIKVGGRNINNLRYADDTTPMAMKETLVQFLGQEDLLEILETGYPLQYSWASLVTQMVKNLPAMRET